MPDPSYRTPPWLAWRSFPFEGNFVPKELGPQVLPEEPRAGEDGKPCRTCGRPDDSYLWVDDDWRVSGSRDPEGIPATVMVEPRSHHDLMDLPPALAAGLGPILQRVEAAIHEIGDIGRVHFARWGDGSAHLHWWVFARPAGYPELRGTFLALWSDVLPPTPRDSWDRNLRTIAAALAVDGGRAMIR